MSAIFLVGKDQGFITSHKAHFCVFRDGPQLPSASPAPLIMFAGWGRCRKTCGKRKGFGFSKREGENQLGKMSDVTAKIRVGRKCSTRCQGLGVLHGLACFWRPQSLLVLGGDLERPNYDAFCLDVEARGFWARNLAHFLEPKNSANFEPEIP